MKPEPMTRVEIHEKMPHVASDFEYEEFIDFTREVEAEVNARWEALLAAQVRKPLTPSEIANFVGTHEFGPTELKWFRHGEAAHGITQVFTPPVQQDHTALLRQTLQALTLVNVTLDLESFPDIYVQFTNAITAIREALK